MEMIDFKDALDKGYTIQFSFTITPYKISLEYTGSLKHTGDLSISKYSLDQYSPKTLQESK